MKNIIICIILIFCFILIQCAPKNTAANKLMINSFVVGSNLQKAGALEGDYILKYDGKIVRSQDHLIQIKNYVTGKEVDMVLLRDGKKIKIKVPIGQLGAILKEFIQDHQVANDAVLIEEIGKLEWGIGMDNSFLACVYLLEQKYGNQLSYVDLLGISGYGFKLNFFDRFCPSSPDATVGFDSGDYLMKKLGYDIKYYFKETEDSCDENITYSTEEEMRKIIIESIDLGWPVIAIDLIETPEWGIITGYQNKGNEYFCRTFFDKTDGYEIAHKFPWLIMVIKNKVAIEIEPLYKESLILAKQLYITPKYGNYFSGITAMNEWIKALKDKQYYADNPETINEISHANWWIFVSLQMARGICSNYLSVNIDKFNIDPEKISQLAKIYKAEADLMVDNYEVLPNQFARNPVVWTADMRTNQIIVMEKLLELEQEALKIINQINKI